MLVEDRESPVHIEHCGKSTHSRIHSIGLDPDP
jgi:hypothetical protein